MSLDLSSSFGRYIFFSLVLFFFIPSQGISHPYRYLVDEVVKVAQRGKKHVEVRDVIKNYWLDRYGREFPEAIDFVKLRMSGGVSSLPQSSKVVIILKEILRATSIEDQHRLLVKNQKLLGISDQQLKSIRTQRAKSLRKKVAPEKVDVDDRGWVGGLGGGDAGAPNRKLPRRAPKKVKAPTKKEVVGPHAKFQDLQSGHLDHVAKFLDVKSLSALRRTNRRTRYWGLEQEPPGVVSAVVQSSEITSKLGKAKHELMKLLTSETGLERLFAIDRLAELSYYEALLSEVASSKLLLRNGYGDSFEMLRWYITEQRQYLESIEGIGVNPRSVREYLQEQYEKVRQSQAAGEVVEADVPVEVPPFELPVGVPREIFEHRQQALEAAVNFIEHQPVLVTFLPELQEEHLYWTRLLEGPTDGANLASELDHLRDTAYEAIASKISERKRKRGWSRWHEQSAAVDSARPPRVLNFDSMAPEYEGSLILERNRVKKLKEWKSPAVDIIKSQERIDYYQRRIEGDAKGQARFAAAQTKLRSLKQEEAVPTADLAEASGDVKYWQAVVRGDNTFLARLEKGRAMLKVLEKKQEMTKKTADVAQFVAREEVLAKKSISEATLAGLRARWSILERMKKEDLPDMMQTAERIRYYEAKKQYPEDPIRVLIESHSARLDVLRDRGLSLKGYLADVEYIARRAMLEKQPLDVVDVETYRIRRFLEEYAQKMREAANEP